MTTETNKVCKKCEDAKPLTEFHKDSKGKLGVMSICKTCRNNPKPIFISHPESGKLCWKCNTKKPTSEFGVDSSRFDKLNPRCKPCMRRATKKSAKAHPETAAKKWQKRYLRDSESIKARIKNSQLERIKNQNYIVKSEKRCRVCKNIEPILGFTRHARSADGYRSECRNCRASYRQTDHYKRLQRIAKHNRRARERNAEGSYKAQDIKIMFDNQNGCCVYCSTKLGKDYHVDHIIPLSRGGSNWASNLQLLCPLCNLRKNAKTPDEFLSIYPREMLIKESKKAAK